MDYLRVNSTDRVSPSNDNSDKMVDFWVLPNGKYSHTGFLLHFVKYIHTNKKSKLHPVNP